MGDSTSSSWQRWGLPRWNEALVDIVFAKGPDTPPEIVHIDATNRLLHAAAKGSPQDDADEIWNSFLNSFPRNRSDFSRLFEASIQTRNWHSTDVDLPFFAQLYLTIRVASADEETFEIGNFRNRLQVLLGFDVSVGHVLNDLPGLWKDVARWTRDTRREGVRRLILPPPENEVIIGHSKRLAFPGFSDQTKLARLLTEHHLDAGSPENKVVDVIGRNRNRFSKRFGKEFDNFIRLLKRGDRLNAVRSPFWGAIVEINWEARANRTSKTDTEFELELDPTDPYTATLILLSRGEGAPDEPWKFQRLAFTVGEMKYEVVRDNPPKQMLIEQLLSTSGQRLLAGTRIFSWLSRGWIGFCRDESERWVASSDLTISSGLWLLVRYSHWARIDRGLRAANRRPDYVLKGVLSDEWVLVGPLRNNPGLREVLQEALDDQDSFGPRLRPPRIRFVDAIRLPEGMLFVAPCLPLVLAEGATKIGWQLKPTAAQHEYHWLRETAEGSSSFKFEVDGSLNLPPTGEMEFRAYGADDEEIDRASIHFITGCVSHHLKQPSDLTSFLKTGDFGQLIPFDATTQSALPGRARNEQKLFPIMQGDLKGVTARPIAIDEISLDWCRCFQILTAIFVRRACIPAQDFFEIIAKIWELSPSKTWARMEDLIENGFVEHLYHRRWRGSVFVGRSRQAAMVDSSEPLTFRITGLMPESALRKLVQSVTTQGGACHIMSSGDLKLLGAIELVVDREEVASAIFADCGITSSRRSPDFKFCDWAELLAAQGDESPRATPERWSAKYASFRPAEEVEKTQILLERWALEQAQPLYRLTYEGGTWSTRSRLWALLAYTAVSQAPIGSLSSDGSLHLQPWLSLPPGFTQRILYHGAGICLRDSNGCRVYPRAPRWDIAAALTAWISNTSSTKSVALSRYHRALSQRAQLDAVKKTAERRPC